MSCFDWCQLNLWTQTLNIILSSCFLHVIRQGSKFHQICGYFVSCPFLFTRFPQVRLVLTLGTPTWLCKLMLLTRRRSCCLSFLQGVMCKLSSSENPVCLPALSSGNLAYSTDLFSSERPTLIGSYIYNSSDSVLFSLLCLLQIAWLYPHIPVCVAVSSIFDYLYYMQACMCMFLYMLTFVCHILFLLDSAD